MIRSTLFSFLLLFTVLGHAQTLEYPGHPDSLYPITNNYINLITYKSYYEESTSTSAIIKHQGKYIVAGHFSGMSQNSGSSLLIDTVHNTIINNRKWRINGVVNSVIADGEGGFYIGGNFTKIGDSSRKYIAQIRSNGQPTSWSPIIDSFVNVIQKRNDTLFICGTFKNFDGKPRSCFAMYSIPGDSLCTNGGKGLFTLMSTIQTFILQKDTLIYGGYGIRKYNFKDDVNMQWKLSFPDYTFVHQLALSPDESTVIYSGEDAAASIIGVSNSLGTKTYNVDVAIFSPDNIDNGKLYGLKVVGNKVFVAGTFESIYSNSSTFYRKGFFAFNPNTGSVLPDDLSLDSYPTFLEAKDDKLLLSGSFTTVRGVSREHFAIIDTGTLNTSAWNFSPLDRLTTLAFNGQTAFIGGNFGGLYSSARNGLAVFDSATHLLQSFNPPNANFVEIKRLFARGDSLFVLGYLSGYSPCITHTYTKFKVYSISTGIEYGTGDIPSNNLDDIIVDSNYIYASYSYKLQRFSLPGLVFDPEWGANFTNTSDQHSMNYLIAGTNNIYAIGDTKYFTCATTLDPKRGYFDVFSKSKGAVHTIFHYEGASNLYDAIQFNHGLLTGNKLFIQGYFSRLNGKPRRNFACININTGLLTDWQPTFPNMDSTKSVFYATSDLKLYRGDIWFGSQSNQVLSDSSLFSGFAAMDTVTGKLIAQPLNFRAINYNNFYAHSVSDFIISNSELTISGGFDSVNNSPFRNIAIFKLSGNILCPGGNSAVTSNIRGIAYQWQMDSGNGYTNLNDNSNFSGTHAITMQLSNIPSAWYGRKLRCMVDDKYSNIFSIKFTNTWTGAVNNSWENPGNWSCGSVPDINTDVIVNSGSIFVSKNTTISSLTIGAGVNFTVSTGAVFVILH